MTHHCGIITGPSKPELMEAFYENTEAEQKTVTFKLANPNPGNGYPDTQDCKIAIFLLNNQGDGESWQFQGRHGFSLVEGEFNIKSSRGFIIFL